MNPELKKKLVIVAIAAAAVAIIACIYFFSGSGAMAPGFQDAVQQRQRMAR